MRFADTEDCQALFSAELKAYNQVMVWFGGDFMLPLMRARLFISKCPPHVKKQYAEDCDLRVGMTWQQFKQKMARNWVVAFKKRRMMIDLGIQPKDDFTPETPDIPADPTSVVPPVDPITPAFNSGVGDTMVDLKCKEEGCGVSFPYSQEKIDWLRAHFGENLLLLLSCGSMPSCCPTHKAVADADASRVQDRRNSSKSPENPVQVPDVQVPAVPDPSKLPPSGNRFGSRRTPNEKE